MCPVLFLHLDVAAPNNGTLTTLITAPDVFHSRPVLPGPTGMDVMARHFTRGIRMSVVGSASF